MNILRQTGRTLLVGFFTGLLLACSSNGGSSSGVYYDQDRYDQRYYDSYYRRGINDHHNRDYRRARPVHRPIARPARPSRGR